MIDQNEIAQARKQITDLTLMKRDLEAELRRSTAILMKFEKYMKDNNIKSAKEKNEIKAKINEFKTHKIQIENTLKFTNNVIEDLKCSTKPSSYFRI